MTDTNEEADRPDFPADTALSADAELPLPAENEPNPEENIEHADMQEGPPALSEEEVQTEETPLRTARELAERVTREMGRALVGQEHLIEMLLTTLLAGGHLLLEGAPGTAKTLAIRTLSRILNVSFARIQFTPDLMPSDILGISVFDPSATKFNLRKGPLFAGLVLADEINRTPPKTQSALLEAMEERRVTIDGISHDLPYPFLVCATQNPVEFEGTYPLPEAQLDRFLLKVVVGYPTLEQEQAILARVQAGFRSQNLDTAHIRPILDGGELQKMQEEVDRVQTSPAVQNYMVSIVRATRENRHLLLGASPRAAVLLMNASRALAALRGRDYVTPDDVKTLAVPALRHRLMLRPESELDGFTAERVLEAVLETIEAPR